LKLGTPHGGTRRGSVTGHADVYNRLAATHTDSSRAKDRSERAKHEAGSSRRSSVDGSARIPGLREYPVEHKTISTAKEMAGVAIGTTFMSASIPEVTEAASPDVSVVAEDDDFAGLDALVHDDDSFSEDNQENGEDGHDFALPKTMDGILTKKRSPVQRAGMCRRACWGMFLFVVAAVSAIRTGTATCMPPGGIALSMRVA
jgi:hypothetical protein